MKKSKTLRISEVVEQMFKEEPEYQAQIFAQTIAKSLPEVLGTYYQFVDKITLAEDLLYIYVKSPAAKQAFGQNAKSICERINDKLSSKGISLCEVRIL